MKIPFLHVYAQPFWHQEAFIVGNREALEALRDAIDSALAEDEGKAVVVAADHEGYDLHVYREEDQSYWENSMLPYTDEANFKPAPDDAVIPWTLYKKRKNAR